MSNSVLLHQVLKKKTLVISDPLVISLLKCEIFSSCCLTIESSLLFILKPVSELQLPKGILVFYCNLENYPLSSP